ncbi:MAG: DUF4340 domain-containing protein [Halobacteriovoraceae bacterium]|nr:DUF4340 domain-containing protein [Halobacteriovoraceae bacterium]MCB9095558.1 DUF4340 domain-containing protein [Halobacteriovoraceae bacterium]
MKLRNLSLLTGILFVASIFVYMNENRRGTDLLSGSDYIKGLDIGKIKKISLSFNDNKKVILTRDSNQFVIENQKSYPADTAKVNDLIYKIASIQVNEKVGSDTSEEGLKKYELDSKSRKYFVELYDNDDKRTVAFSVGKTQKGKGNYLYKEGSNEIYLSGENLWLNSSHKDFINTVLLDVKKDEIERISLKTDKEIELEKVDKEFVIKRPEKSNLKKEKANDYASKFNNLRFEDYFAYNDSELNGVQFSKDIKIQLKNKMVYKVSLGKKKDNHYIKVNALVNEVPKKIVVKQDDDKEKLQNIEDMIQAQGQAQKINMEKGNWVYKVDKSTFEKIAVDSKFFM